MKNFRYRGGHWREEDSKPVVEKVVTIFINGDKLVNIPAAFSKVEELVIGFLFTEGIIGGPQDILSLEIDEDMSVRIETTRQISIPESQKKISKFGYRKDDIALISLREIKRTYRDLRFLPKDIINLASRYFEKASRVNKNNKNIAGVFTTEGKLLVASDIGRLNAVDKSIGSYLLTGGGNPIFLISGGRICSKIVIKSARLGVDFIVTSSFPTDTSIVFAKQLGITLIGELNKKGFRVWTHPERIDLTEI